MQCIGCDQCVGFGLQLKSVSEVQGIRKKLGTHEDFTNEIETQIKRNFERWKRVTHYYSPGVLKVHATHKQKIAS